MIGMLGHSADRFCIVLSLFKCLCFIEFELFCFPAQLIKGLLVIINSFLFGILEVIYLVIIVYL